MNHNTNEKALKPAKQKLQRHLLAIRNVRFARRMWETSRDQVTALKDLTTELQLSVAAGHLKLIECNWYVTHAGLLRIAQRNRCSGMRTAVDKGLSDPAANRWVFKATVYKSLRSRASSATATPIPPTSRPWSTAPRCASPKLAPSTVPSARPTASDSVRSRNSAGPPGPPAPDHPISVAPVRTETRVITTASLASATVFAC